MNNGANRLSTLPAPEILDQMDADIYKVAIFRAALELQVWAKIAAGQDTAEALAASQQWDPVGTRMLLDDLAAFRLLERRGLRYGLVPEAESYLLPDQPTYMGNFLISDLHWEGDGQLAEAIRSGKRPIGYRATTGEAIDTWVGAYARSWAAPESYLARCDTMWQQLGIRPQEGLRVLDVACGPAPRSFALARAHPGVHITLVDWERILQVASEVAANLGIASQVTARPGDLWSTPYGSNQFDVAYLGNITHFFSAQENTRLFQRVLGALVEGGILVVNALRREYPDPMGPALWFYAVSEGGAPYDFMEYKGMLERAGYTDIEDVSNQPIRALKRSLPARP